MNAPDSKRTLCTRAPAHPDAPGAPVHPSISLKHDVRHFDRLVASPGQRRGHFDAGERAHFMKDRRSPRGEEPFDGIEVAIGGRLMDAEAERLRDRRADAGEHHLRAGDLGPDRAGVRLAPRLRVDERGVAVTLGGFEAPRQRGVGENGAHGVRHVTLRARRRRDSCRAIFLETEPGVHTGCSDSAPGRGPGHHSIPLNCSKLWPLAMKTSAPMNSATLNTTATLTIAMPVARRECSR